METTAINPNGIVEAGAQGPSGSAGEPGLPSAASLFFELMRSTAARLDTDGNVLAERSYLTPRDTREPEYAPRERTDQRRDGPDDRRVDARDRDYGRDTELADETREPARERETDDRLADRGGNRDDGRGDERSDDLRPLDHEAPGDAAHGSPVDDAADDPAQAQGAGTETDTAPNGGDSAADDAIAQTGSIDSTAAAVAASAGQTTGTQAELVLDNLLARASQGNVPGERVGQMETESDGDDAASRPERGLQRALSALQQQNQAATPSERVGLMPGGNATQSTQPADAASQTQVRADGAVNAAARTQQQTAALAAMVGSGNRVSVAVDVADETALISRPSLSLTSTSTSANNGQNSPSGDQPQGQGAAMPGTLLANSQTQSDANAQGGTRQAFTPASAAASAADGRGAAAAAPLSGATAQSGASDGMAPSGPATATTASQSQQASASQSTAARPAGPPPAVVDQVSVQITKAVAAGADRINIQLKPESLGRIDVRIELTQDGRITAVVTADNKDTLELLQRDSRSLERAFQNAGLNADSDSLSFNLREQNPDGQDREHAGDESAADSEDADDTADDGRLIASDPGGNESGIGPDGRVDIRA